jgi:hypothetical protein
MEQGNVISAVCKPKAPVIIGRPEVLMQYLSCCLSDSLHYDGRKDFFTHVS